MVRVDDGDPTGAELGWRLSTAVVLFHEAVADRLGLTAADHKALGIITRADGLTAGALAERTGLSPGAVTGLIDRLETAGHVVRRGDPQDRRRVVVFPAHPARTDLDGVFTDLSAAMLDVVAGYDEREAAAIRDYLIRTIAVLEEQTRRLSKASEPAGSESA